MINEGVKIRDENVVARRVILTLCTLMDSGGQHTEVGQCILGEL